MLAGLGLLAVLDAARAEIDPLTRQPLMQTRPGQGAGDRHPARGRLVQRQAQARHDRDQHQPSAASISSCPTARRCATASASAAPASTGPARRPSPARPEWPTWTPPAQMLKRRPDLPRFMPGGPENPMGARAMYLGSTLYRIHGSNEPETIGQAVSSGCIRMLNDDVIDLYDRAKVGTRVVVAR
jgi:hypothetical protein